MNPIHILTRMLYYILACIFTIPFFAAYAADDTPAPPPGIHHDILQWIDSQNRPAHPHSLDTSDRLFVYVYLDSEKSIDLLPDYIPVLSSSYNIVVSSLTADQIIRASFLDIVTKISLPERPTHAYHGVSEGVAFMGADTMHKRGFTGDNITVAVIDTDFAPDDPQISANILSSRLIDSADLCDGDITCHESDSHGNAVAEIVVDMAPDVGLHLYAISNSVDFNKAIDDAISKDVDIIQASLGFDFVGPESGTLFRSGQSHVAKKVNEAESHGIAVVVAAGNGAAEHYLAKYVPSRTVLPADIGLSGQYESVMEFYPGESGTQKVCLPIDNDDHELDLFLVWNDSWTNSLHDYDLYVYDDSMRRVLYSSVSDNPHLEPTEWIYEYMNVKIDTCLVVASFRSSENHVFRIMTPNHMDPQYLTRYGSIGTPADATGAIAVGAVDANTNRLTEYSSSGPTDDGRPKPETCGVTNTLNHQYASFGGTSSATPHVSGLIALLMEADPTLQGTGRDKILDVLNRHARQNSDYSQANLCGPGVASLASYKEPSTPPATPDPVPDLESRIVRIETMLASLQDIVESMQVLFVKFEERVSTLEGHTIARSHHDGSFVKIHNHKDAYAAGDVITLEIRINSDDWNGTAATAHIDYGLFLVAGGTDNTVSGTIFTGAGYLGRLFGTALFGPSGSAPPGEFYGPGFYCNGAGTDFDLKFKRESDLSYDNYNGWGPDPMHQKIPCTVAPNNTMLYTISITDDYPARDDYAIFVGTNQTAGFATPEFAIN